MIKKNPLLKPLKRSLYLDQKPIAILTIKGASSLTKQGKRGLANWLIKHANSLEADGHNYAFHFRGRYYVNRQS